MAKLSTRELRIKALESEIERHKAYGDTVAMDICCRDIEEYESMTDSEYEAMVKLRKRFATTSVIPFIPKGEKK